ncbi:MAG TPA: hypothetical protein VF589_05170, partial [Allosphingosinicella sp.]
MSVSEFSRRRAFAASVSLAALAMASAAAPALAQEACGPVAEGVVTCDEADAPFPQGIAYSTSEDLTVVVEDGLTVAPDAGVAGVILSSEGSVTLQAGGADVVANGASAIFAAGSDDMTIVVDDAAATGDYGRGIDTFTFWGDTEIVADSVSTSGRDALGITA